MKLLRILTLTALLLPASMALQAQGTPVPATDDTRLVTTSTEPSKITETTMSTNKTMGSMVEFGLRPSYSWVAGDVESTGGYGIGLHFRKAFDHVFSIRVQGLYAATSGDDGTDRIGNRRFESRWTSGSLMGIATLNNIKYEGERRNTNVYVMAGGGGHSFRTASQADDATTFDDEDPLDDNSRNDILDGELRAHFTIGAGFAVRVSPRFNIGVEYQAYAPLGKRADLIDGYADGKWRDVQNNASLMLNFNLGNASTRTEPRYWENPFNAVKNQLRGMDDKINAATNDADGDGVVDAMDVEANTPMGASVDTKGRVLDSDGDGVPDYQDLEPFFPPRQGETVDANGVVTNRKDKPITEDRVQQMIDASIARMQATAGPTTTTVVTNSGTMYLPIIYFPLNQSTVKFADYGTLSGVARVLQGNPGMRLVVRGYTDEVGASEYNERLSYKRAENVINHLVNQHGVARNRLVLQYRGEADPLVPKNRSMVNRRVEFLSADGSTREDSAPGGSSGRRGY